MTGGIEYHLAGTDVGDGVGTTELHSNRMDGIIWDANIPDDENTELYDKGINTQYMKEGRTLPFLCLVGYARVDARTFAFHLCDLPLKP